MLTLIEETNFKIDILLRQTYLGSYQASKMEIFLRKWLTLNLVNIFAKSFVSDALKGPPCAYVCGNRIPS